MYCYLVSLCLFLPLSNVLAIGLVTPAINRTTIRQASENKLEFCPEFTLSYDQMRQATTFMLKKLDPIGKSYKQCKDCLLCDVDCETPRNNAIAEITNQCSNEHPFFSCLLAVLLLGLGDTINAPCLPYFKSSRVGNCYIEEYFTLNGFKGTNNALVFDREVGTLSDPFLRNSFQCRAGSRVSASDLEDQDLCRQKFRVSVEEIHSVSTCASPAISNAYVRFTRCYINAQSFTDRSSCHGQLRFERGVAYRSCVTQHGAAAVAVASIYTGDNALSCPVFRRDSWVGRCRAPDFVQLKNFELLKVESNSIGLKIPDACTY